WTADYTVLPHIHGLKCDPGPSLREECCAVVHQYLGKSAGHAYDGHRRYAAGGVAHSALALGRLAADGGAGRLVLCVMTFMATIETAWFAPVMTTMPLTPALIRALFVQTVPVVLIFVPAAVLLLGKGRQPPDVEPGLMLTHPLGGWVWRLALIAASYL